MALVTGLRFMTLYNLPLLFSAHISLSVLSKLILNSSWAKSLIVFPTYACSYQYCPLPEMPLHNLPNTCIHTHTHTHTHTHILILGVIKTQSELQPSHLVAVGMMPTSLTSLSVPGAEESLGRCQLPPLPSKP